MKNLIELVTFLWRDVGDRRARRGVVLLTVCSAIAGAASTALLATINLALSRAAARTTTLALAFFGLCLFLPVARYLSQALLARLSEDMAFDLRIRMSARILQVPLRQLEQVGPARLLASLTGDVSTIVDALATVPLLGLHLTVVAGCLFYLGWLSWQLLIVVLAAVAAGTAGYRLPLASSAQYFSLARQRSDALVGHLRGLVEGAKELKTHRRRRQAFLAEALQPAAAAMRDYNLRGRKIYAAASSAGQVLFFVVIGLILFVLPHGIAVSERTITGFVLAVLYMLTPMDVILNVLPTLSRAQVAMAKIASLGVSLATVEPDSGPGDLPAAARPSWRRLSLRRVAHTFYREDEDDSFTLGPLDVELRPAELVFVTGGNGSGKTTLAKLIIGLYMPQAGEVRLDGTLITDRNRDSYRQLFAVVFSDFFLFDSLLGLADAALDEEARRYLAALHLDRKVKVVAGALSTLELSQGQRKRLALLTAYLEDRPIYLFDEWAADQDPQFKRIFYLQLLPELKRRGKTVVVISHDDQYYAVADRIIKLDHGQIELGEPVQEAFAAPLPPPVAS